MKARGDSDFSGQFLFDRLCSSVNGRDSSLTSSNIVYRLPHEEAHWNDKTYTNMPPYFRVVDEDDGGSSFGLEIRHHDSIGSFAR